MTAPMNEQRRETLAGIADVLIPAGDGMPSASEAGVAGPLLDKVLAARPDLAAPLAQLLDDAQGRPPADVVADLRQNDAQVFGVLANVVPGGYFMSEDVRERIGYHGQTAKPIDPDAPPDYLEDGLLQSVIERGPIYRPTPS